MIDTHDISAVRMVSSKWKKKKKYAQMLMKVVYVNANMVQNQGYLSSLCWLLARKAELTIAYKPSFNYRRNKLLFFFESKYVAQRSSLGFLSFIPLPTPCAEAWTSREWLEGSLLGQLPCLTPILQLFKDLFRILTDISNH